jgi:hypothetical protein
MRRRRARRCCRETSGAARADGVVHARCASAAALRRGAWQLCATGAAASACTMMRAVTQLAPGGRGNRPRRRRCDAGLVECGGRQLGTAARCRHRHDDEQHDGACTLPRRATLHLLVRATHGVPARRHATLVETVVWTPLAAASSVVLPSPHHGWSRRRRASTRPRQPRARQTLFGRRASSTFPTPRTACACLPAIPSNLLRARHASGGGQRPRAWRAY